MTHEASIKYIFRYPRPLFLHLWSKYALNFLVKIKLLSMLTLIDTSDQ